MRKLALTVACDDYDHLRPLRDGRVVASGIDLRLLTVESGSRHHRMSEHGEYDACEFSMGSYMVARSLGHDALQAIPFFVRRMFCHRFCFVRAGSGITSPADLPGRRVGVLGLQNSLAIVARGMLAHHHGVPLDAVTWVTTRAERVDVPPPAGVTIERADGRSLEELLLAGEIDMMVGPDLPSSWLRGEGKLVRLFADHAGAERAFHRATGVFPIMHPLVVKSVILERHPWVAASLFEAFCRSQELHRAWMQQPHRLGLVWPTVAEERQFFGKDPFAQGLSGNRLDVATMVHFASEQGLLARPLGVDELFAPGTRHT